MRSTVIDRLRQEFGTPSITKKVQRWAVRPDVGVVVELDTAHGRSSPAVWVPYPGRSHAIPSNATVYEAGRGRHSNTYCVAGLAKGLAALRLRITTPEQVDELVRFIRVLPPIRGLH